MRKVMQSLKTGEISLIETSSPAPSFREVLIETRKTLISTGTERMLLEFGKGNLIQKALQQPDKARMTLARVKTDGLAATYEAVTSKLDQPISLGYCNAGIVRAIGKEVSHVKVGDRVVSNGSHAELVVIGRNLVAKVPDNVSDEEAAFTPLASIALQGIRLAAPTLGETFCVMGLGLVGLMTVQLLKANGCRVIGVDFSKERLALAARWGAETVNLKDGVDPIAAAQAAMGGVGVDGVIIAAATDSHELMHQAAAMSRKRGRIILVGVTGLNISRADFFEKELSFQVSCSYGPGRYDDNYEKRGEDYPIGFIRWTEQRNFEACLQAMSDGQLDVRPLISSTVDILEAPIAYQKLADKTDDSLGLILNYEEGRVDLNQTSATLNALNTPAISKGVVAMIGAGNFGSRVTAPGLKAVGARLKTIVSRGGVSGTVEGQKLGFEESHSDFDTAINDPDIDTVIITSRHDSHAQMTIDALNAGKHVFVEKPLALTLEDIDAIETAWKAQDAAGHTRHLMVGFNRRFAPLSIEMKKKLDSIQEPKCLIAIINAGSIESDHWVHDPKIGGGRIIGEACHMIDLMAYFVGAKITDVHSTSISKLASDGVTDDKTSITLSFDDGSIATVHYFANGPKTLSKERYEAFGGMKVLQLDNFRTLKMQGFAKSKSLKARQDKGHNAALAAFIDAVQNGKPTPISIEETFAISRLSIQGAGG